MLSPRVPRRLIAVFASSGPVASQAVAEMTPREREVLALVARGMSNSEIARGLTISHATVKFHISRTLTKLAARDRAQLVMRAYETGIALPGTRD